MSPRMASVTFAVLWTAGMLWWTAPRGVAHAVILIIAGRLAGLTWHWLFGRWIRRYRRRSARVDASARSYEPPSVVAAHHPEQDWAGKNADADRNRIYEKITEARMSTRNH